MLWWKLREAERLRNSQMVPSHLLSLHPIACLEDTTVCECVSVCVFVSLSASHCMCELVVAHRFCCTWYKSATVYHFSRMSDAEGARWRRPSVKVKNHWVNSAVVYPYTVTTSGLSQMCSQTFSWRQIIEFFLLSLKKLQIFKCAKQMYKHADPNQRAGDWVHISAYTHHSVCVIK